MGRVCGPIALHDGPDAAQEALIAIFRNLGGLRDPAAIYGWARDRCAGGGPGGRDGRTGRPGRTRRCPTPRDPQLAADVRDVLRRLTPEHRAVLVLRDLRGLDEQAAVALLNVPAATVRTRLFRARLSFRKAWLP